jgi:hypothetical protein
MSENDDTTGIEGILDGASEMMTDRRKFMSGAAKLGVGGALASFATGGAAAQEGDGEEVADVDILNFALTLEELEATYYEEALDEFDELRDFEPTATSSGSATTSGPTLTRCATRSTTSVASPLRVSSSSSPTRRPRSS